MGPKMGEDLRYLRDSEDSSVTGTEWSRRMVGQENRIKGGGQIR